MPDVPTPRERRSVKLPVYVTARERNQLRVIAKLTGISVSELCGEILRAMIAEVLKEGEKL